MVWAKENKVKFPLSFQDVLENPFYTSDVDYISFIKDWEKNFPMRVEKENHDINPCVVLMSYFTAYVYFYILEKFYFGKHKLPQKDDPIYFLVSRLKNTNQKVYSEDWELDSVWSLYKEDGVSINSIPESLFVLAWVYCWYTLASIFATGRSSTNQSSFLEYFLKVRNYNSDVFYVFFNEAARVSVSHVLAALNRFIHLWSSFSENFELFQQIKKSGAFLSTFFIQTPSYGKGWSDSWIPVYLSNHIKEFSKKDSIKITNLAKFSGSQKILESNKHVPGFIHFLFKDFGSSTGPHSEDSDFEKFCFCKLDYFGGLCFLEFAPQISIFYDYYSPMPTNVQ